MTQLALAGHAPVVAAVRAVTSVARTRSGAFVGRCRCGRVTLYVSQRGGWWLCFSCGLRGDAETVGNLRREALDGSGF